MVEQGDRAVVEFFDGAPDGLSEFAQAHPEDVTVLRASAFNAADPGTTELLVVLTPLVLRALTKIVTAQIAARKHVTVKVGGVELTGVSGKDAVEVLMELADREAP